MKGLLILAAILLSVISFSSCDKAAKLLFQPFESPLNVNVSIPVVTTTEVESSLGETNVDFNLDEEVKKNTDGKVDGSVVGAMYLNEVGISLLNPDETNNLSNFEYVTLAVSSSGSTPVVFGPFQIPANSTANATFGVSNSPNIKPYFNGADVKFILRGKAKSQTDKILETTIGATIKFDK